MGVEPDSGDSFAAGEATPVRTGVSGLLSAGGAREERLPILEVICDRVVRSFSTNMRHLTSRVIDVRLAEMQSARFGELVDRIALPALFGVFRIPEWDNHGVVIADAGLAYMAVEAMLGGPSGDRARTPAELRAFTSIETSLVSRMMQLALTDLAEAFAPIARLSMTLERLESNPRLASVVGPGISTAACSFHIELDGRGGRLAVLLPHTTLEPVRDKLVQRFIGERLGKDQLWEAHFGAEIRKTALDLRAVIAERALPLREVQSWRPGQTLLLDRGGSEAVTLQSDGVPLAAAQLGQRNGRIAVRLLEQPKAA